MCVGLQVDDAFIDALVSNTELHTLNFSQTAVTNKGMLLLCKSVPRITSLIAEGCTGLQGSMPGLCEFSSLSKLSLSGCRHVSAADVVSSISAATGLTHLNLSWCTGTQRCRVDLTRALLSLQALQELLLDHATLMDPVAALQAALSLPCLAQLSMSSFPFSTSDDQNQFASGNFLDGSDEVDDSSEESETIRASWAGDQAVQLASDVTGHVHSSDHHAADRIRKSVSAPLPTAPLTMLTLRSSNVSPPLQCPCTAMYNHIVHGDV